MDTLFDKVMGALNGEVVPKLVNIYMSPFFLAMVQQSPLKNACCQRMLHSLLRVKWADSRAASLAARRAK